MAHQHAHPFHQRPRPHRPGRSFALVNGLTFAVHLLLACAAEGLLATRVAGQINLGVVALVAQGSLLLWTAARYDRAAHEEAAYEAEEEH
ncbi:hypothetical protein QFZ82_001387 [Streptomyces sp. V4I23]|uniref:hypothetical protein n=1 Tax=Streptomyces sp. V4I23 TaxID=3042282 RepID=UPI002781316A|nr:hypothetical protein [Streptomyces sp. V4I23]MDQ1006902.1 hypothetical protein [Streptomyces sp. V4I23]